MAKLIFENTHHEVDLPDGSDISEACEKEGVPFACPGGICGVCAIEVLEGMENLSPFTDAEKNFFNESENKRLACQCIIKHGQVKVRF